MEAIAINTIFSEKTSDSDQSLLGCWEMREKSEDMVGVTVVDTMEFFSDGICRWRSYDTSGLVKADTDSFTWWVDGERLLFRFRIEGQSESQHFKVTGDQLELISYRGTESEFCEIYTRKEMLPQLEYCIYGNE
ncbi:hypothetical protein HCH04_14925 [Bacteroides thetaiotaomicron]|uniref:hypothetical protein n=1 Tax=Bacteroides thetaiotaomicron TaxID=818 RepID=UPI001C8B6F61|nr:hypothetical protein [Bacteroides thetaiotaomicron]MBX9049604.1 hypothetical protein [Bacteroides thetaiotaomicron]MBX9074254.1 hypothetical protein [Bacteroides thetaiotaomicron]